MNAETMRPIEKIMRTGPVIPVLTIHDVSVARPIAEALVRGGLRVLEVTLRTPVALDVIREMRTVAGAIVGAGTVIDERGLQGALDAGSEFIVSPGLTRTLGQAVVASGVPYLPGVATASDIMQGLELGLKHFKFFPAETSGGLPALKALAAPFGGARFCPTGGITAESMMHWLAFDSVLCVGGSWLVPAGPVDAGDIERRARDAVARRG